MAEFQYPREGYHTAVVGMTGSGKSTLSAYILSKAPFHIKPAFIIDIKRDELFSRCLRLREIGIHEQVPRQAGLYILRPRPDEAFRADGTPDIETWLEKLWHTGNAWLYIDESYLMPDKAWLRNILTQGRSLGITVIATSQRPVDVPLPVFTEATYFSAFNLSYKKDKQRVDEYTVPGLTDVPLLEYHSVWYDRFQHKAGDPRPYLVLSPVPGADAIIEAIDSRLRPRHTIL